MAIPKININAFSGNKRGIISKINKVISRVNLSVDKMRPVFRMPQIESSGFKGFLLGLLPMPVLSTNEGLVIEQKPAINGNSGNVFRIAFDEHYSGSKPVSLHQMKVKLAELTGNAGSKAALAYALEIEKKYPDDLWNIFTIAQLSAEARDLDRASEYVKKYLEALPDSGVGWALLGRILFDQGKKVDGLKYLDKAIHMEPSQKKFLDIKLQLLLTMEISELQGAPKLMAEWLVTRSILKKEEGDLKQALRYLETATTVNPLIDDHAWIFQLDILREQKDTAGELKCLNRWLDAKPNNITALFSKAMILLKMNDEESAIKCLRAIHRIDPLELDTLYCLGKLLINRGHIQEGLEYLFKEKIAAPNDYSRMGRRMAILAKLSKVAPEELAPHPLLRSEVLFYASNELSNKNKYDKALILLQQVLELDPGNVFAWECIGIAMGETGKKLEAIKCFDRSLELNPSNPLVLYNKGVYLEDLHETEKAIVCYEAALKINPQFEDAAERLKYLLAQNN